MKNDFRNTIISIICLSVIVLFLILVINGQKKANVEITSSKNNYDVYDVDEIVKLNDDSLWYVLGNNTNTDKNVTLISKDKVNDEVIDNVNYYVNEIYFDKICNSLSISREQLGGIRLLNENDVCNLYEIDNLKFTGKFDTSKYKMFEVSTITDYYIDKVQTSLCDDGFCINDNTDIRVVINIPKHFIKKDK